MFFSLLKLRLLKAIRSVSLSRKLLSGFFMFLIGFIVLSNIFVLGMSLDTIIEGGAGQPDVISFVNTYIIFFLLAETMYRFFLQKISALELANFLHLPVGRSKIIHFILLNSFITALNIVALLLFAPFALTEIKEVYGLTGSLYWLFTVLVTSWSIHWFMLWFKQKYEDNISAILILFGIYVVSTAGLYYGWFNIGEWVAPFFDSALQSGIPLVLMIAVGTVLYMQVFRYYRNHAYLEELQSGKDSRFFSGSISPFNRFGLAGTIADLELRLILRHKRPRTQMAISMLFLLYGLLFYGDANFTDGIPGISIFIGIFITGVFIMNYGQYFLSWNAAYFDFYSSRYQGIKALVKGKYLLFGAFSLLCFLLSIPYVYYGWQILFIHGATFLFNIGITIHFITYIALWKPKPIDINRRGMFNYEGMGAAQFLIIIPVAVLPYLIYLPFSWWISDAVGLAMLAITGTIGIIFHKQLTQLQVNRILKQKYVIGSSFRQEL